MYEKLEFLEEKYKIVDFPLNVILEPGNYCNLNCITCVNNELKRKRGTLNTFLFKKVVDEIASVNPYTRLWLDFYGEPLIQKYKLYYFIKYAKEKGLEVITIK